MRFALYCRELRASGGRAIGISLIRALARHSWSYDLTAYVPDDPEYRKLDGGSIRMVFKRVGGGAGNLLAHHQFRKELATDQQDAIYMMGNMALRNTPCPQAVYFHQPWALYPESPAWQRCSRKERYYRSVRNILTARSLRHAQVVSSQTPVMLKRLHRQMGIPYSRLALVPNAVSPEMTADSGETPSSQRMRKQNHQIRAFCLARYMTHKNLEVLLQVADLLLRRDRTNIGLYITIDPSQGEGARRLLEQIEIGGRQQVLHNLGEVPMADVPSCYRAASALLLPTLLESFSGTYIDAMRMGVPIITSDLDFAHTVCANAALYVDPLDAGQILSALLTLDSDPAGWRRRTIIGKERVSTIFMDYDAIAERVIDLLTCVAQGKSVVHLLDHPWVRETIDFDALKGSNPVTN